MATAAASVELVPAPAGGAGTDARCVHLVAPTAAEVAQFARDEGVPEELVRHALDPHERPRVHTVGGATLVVLRVPFERNNGIPYDTVPLGLLLTGDCVATVCARDTDVVARLRERANDLFPAGQQHRFVIRVLDVVAETYLAHLERIDRNVNRLEKGLRASLENREVLKLLEHQKSLVHFAMALRSTELMLERLKRSPVLRVPEEDQALLEDVLVEFRQAIDVAAISSNILGEMMDAFASIIANNLNVVLKFLAGVTIVLTVPVTVASFYGMNVALPGAGSPNAFVWVLLVSMALSAVVAVLLRRRRWL